MTSEISNNHVRVQDVYIPWLQKLVFEIPFLENFVSSARQFLRVTKAQSFTRIEQDESVDQRDIMSKLLEAKNQSTGEPLAKEELISEAVILLIAGDHTICANEQITNVNV